MYFNHLLIFLCFLIFYILCKTNDTETYNNKLQKKIINQEELILKLNRKHRRAKKINDPTVKVFYDDKYIIPAYQYKQEEDPVYMRDQKVLYNRLYPPLGRTERPQFDLLMNYINSNNGPDGMFNYYTRGSPDTYRILGYLTPTIKVQTIDSTLILYGRAKFPNSDMGEFYVSSSNKISDIKIPLTEYNSNIRRITDLPQVITIKGNMLNGDYNFMELPKADLTYPYI